MNINVRKILALLAVINLLVITACKEDDNPVSPGNNLVGTWVLTKIYLTQFNNAEIKPGDYDISATFDMKSNGTFTAIENYSGEADTTSGTWSEAGGKIKLTATVDGVNQTEELSYTLQGNLLLVDTTIEMPTFGEQPVRLEFTKQ
ncbi:MAG: lipocalin family protein [Ignavibacteriales bacterium]|nr:lipocalin family protein [Ignavibacteriales bacterium]